MGTPSHVTILADRVVKRGRSPEAATNEAEHDRGRRRDVVSWGQKLGEGPGAPLVDIVR